MVQVLLKKQQSSRMLALFGIPKQDMNQHLIAGLQPQPASYHQIPNTLIILTPTLFQVAFFLLFIRVISKQCIAVSHQKNNSLTPLFLLDVEMKERVTVLFSMVNSVQKFISTSKCTQSCFWSKKNRKHLILRATVCSQVLSQFCNLLFKHSVNSVNQAYIQYY